jgi:membrane protein YdbS with pleckstrin-like domain
LDNIATSHIATSNIELHGDHQLDPRFIPHQQLVGRITYAVLAIGLLAFGVGGTLGARRFGWLLLLLLLGWMLIAGFLFWVATRWPVIDYQRTSYRVDASGLEIRRGVWWRSVISVPRTRIQHTDVSQGPLERRFGLGTLVVHTAGTSHARVELAGLDHARALRIRDYLLPHDTRDAV